MAYDHQSLEQKWQKYWEENKTYLTPNPPPKGEENAQMPPGG